MITIQQFKKDGDGLALPKTLREMKPYAIIMYDVDITAVRQIEVNVKDLLAIRWNRFI